MPSYSGLHLGQVRHSAATRAPGSAENEALAFDLLDQEAPARQHYPPDVICFSTSSSWSTATTCRI
jgi:hypothetical protein